VARLRRAHDPATREALTASLHCCECLTSRGALGALLAAPWFLRSMAACLAACAEGSGADEARLALETLTRSLLAGRHAFVLTLQALMGRPSDPPPWARREAAGRLAGRGGGAGSFAGGRQPGQGSEVKAGDSALAVAMATPESQQQQREEQQHHHQQQQQQPPEVGWEGPGPFPSFIGSLVALLEADSPSQLDADLVGWLI
jgi:hypothetical protein